MSQNHLTYGNKFETVRNNCMILKIHRILLYLVSTKPVNLWHSEVCKMHLAVQKEM